MPGSPRSSPKALTDRMPWLARLKGTSVTETEIFHGVLNDPHGDSYAFFYIRDPAWVTTRPADDQAAEARSNATKRSQSFVARGAAAAAAARRDRLEDLKRKVRETGRPTSQYPDPKALGPRLLADLTAMIDELYRNALPLATPLSIRRLLERCLYKDPKRRLRDIGDARVEIEELSRLPRRLRREGNGLPSCDLEAVKDEDVQDVTHDKGQLRDSVSMDACPAGADKALPLAADTPAPAVPTTC